MDIKLMAHLLIEKIKQRIDHLRFQLYGPTYHFCQPDYTISSAESYSVYIWEPKTEGNGVAIRLVFFNNGEIVETINCYHDQYLVMSLPWGGIVTCYAREGELPEAQPSTGLLPSKNICIGMVDGEFIVTVHDQVRIV